MSRIAYVDGQYTPLELAAVHVEDRGYQFADGIYEVCALRNGVMLDEEAHLDRYERSLKELSIKQPMSRQALKRVLRETVRLNRVQNGLLYFQVTRGQAPREHAYPENAKPVLVITVRPAKAGAAENLKQHGIKVITVPDQRWGRCDIKSIALLPNVMARQLARENDATEAWQLDTDGYVTEGAITNAWIVDAKGVLRTRPVSNDILSGIIRQILLELIKANDIAFCETAFTLKEALIAQEAFSTASTLTVFPVVEIDKQVIGNGKPGPVALKLLEAYQTYQPN